MHHHQSASLLAQSSVWRKMGCLSRDWRGLFQNSQDRSGAQEEGPFIDLHSSFLTPWTEAQKQRTNKSHMYFTFFQSSLLLKRTPQLTMSSTKDESQAPNKLRDGPCSKIYEELEKCAQANGVDMSKNKEKLQSCPSHTDRLIKCMNKNPSYFYKWCAIDIAIAIAIVIAGTSISKYLLVWWRYGDVERGGSKSWSIQPAYSKGKRAVPRLTRL